VDEKNTPPTPPNLGDSLKDAVRPALENLADLAVQLWWFWLIVGAVLLLRFLNFVRVQRRLARSGIRDIDAMDGPTFEKYLATMFRRLGYRVDLVGSRGGDYGGDLVIRKNGTRTIVQAKCYRAKKVGIKAVQEAHTARAMYDCTDAIVVTNNFFTPQAQKTARATRVQLWGRDQLVKTLLQVRNVQPVDDGEQTAPVSSEPALAVVSAPARCARCGADVSSKVEAYCLADAKRFGGLVYCYSDQKHFRAASA
jgi:restriction system protein